MSSYLLLERRLANCEGKMAAVNRLACEWPANSELLQRLVRLAETADPHLQKAATGLLKRYQHEGVRLPAGVQEGLLDLLPAPLPWETRLHILQMIPAFTMGGSRAEAVAGWLEQSLAAETNCFVRAWTYGALHCIATQHPALRAGVDALLQRGRRTESASVRARLRKLSPPSPKQRQRP